MPPLPENGAAAPAPALVTAIAPAAEPYRTQSCKGYPARLTGKPPLKLSPAATRYPPPDLERREVFDLVRRHQQCATASKLDDDQPRPALQKIARGSFRQQDRSARYRNFSSFPFSCWRDDVAHEISPPCGFIANRCRVKQTSPPAAMAWFLPRADWLHAELRVATA